MSEQQTSVSLHAFITTCRRNGVDDTIIRDNLLQVGWRKDVIDRALIGNTPIPIPQEKEKGSRWMWDAFEHILLFISLYVLVISVGSVFYTLINYYIAPVTEYYRLYQSLTSMVAAPVAAILVSFPLFVFFFTRVTRRTAQIPEIRSLVVRKLLIYGTLIVAFVTSLVNVTTVLYSVLTGEITMNAVLKMFVVLILAGSVAGYYLIQVKEDATIKD